MRAPELILASASPRRRALLESAGLVFTVIEPHVPEAPLPGESPRAYGRRVAAAKARAVAAPAGCVVLAADTEVVLEDRVLGKPQDEAHARELLTALAGREHTVITAVCVRATEEEVFEVETVVRLEATPRMIDWYVRTGEPMGKAGAYAVQGSGGALVTVVRGSYSAVVGLPLAETLAALARAGLPLPWSAP